MGFFLPALFGVTLVLKLRFGAPLSEMVEKSSIHVTWAKKKTHGILVVPTRPRIAGATGHFSLVIRILDRSDLLWMDRL